MPLYSICEISIRDSIVVSIRACHARDPGSIPGRGVFCIAKMLLGHVKNFKNDDIFANRKFFEQRARGNLMVSEDSSITFDILPDSKFVFRFRRLIYNI